VAYSLHLVASNLKIGLLLPGFSWDVPHQIVQSFCQGIVHGEGRYVSSLRIVLLLPAATSANQHVLPDAGIQAGLQVGQGISDHNGALKVNIQFKSRLQDQARSRFTAITIVAWRMGAYEQTINPAANLPNFSQQALIDFIGYRV
jgi:hypothetical protein